jgi:hypothetical protein
MSRVVIALAAAALMAHASDPLYESARRKLDLIESRQAKPGSVFNFSAAEVNAWAPIRVPDYVPKGLRNPRVELGEGTANGYALIDLLKMRDAQGIMAKLIEGERPVKISVRVQSSGGRCTVYLTRLEISGVIASGGVLDFLIKTFFVPMYPDAKINEPFDLDYSIERIDVRPSGVRVTIKK